MIIIKNRHFCFTGALENFTRDQAVELIEARGGRFDKSVTARTDYLVVAKDPGKTKLARANHWYTKQITEQDLATAILVSEPGFVPRKNIVVQHITNNTTINIVQPKKRKIDL